MGIFDSIKNAIWGKAEEEAPAAEAPAAAPEAAKPAAPAPKAEAVKAEPAKAEATPVKDAPKEAAKPAEAPAAAAKPAPTKATAPAQNVDVTAILDAAVKKSGQTLNWRTSIVDLMKALGLDSSLTARKELAAELGYTGDTADSAAMNIWLHGQVIRKLADNGGQVPADLL